MDGSDVLEWPQDSAEPRGPRLAEAGPGRAALAAELITVFFLTPLFFVFVIPGQYCMGGLFAAAIWAVFLIRKHRVSGEELGLGRTGRANQTTLLVVALAVGLTLAGALAIGLHLGLPAVPPRVTRLWFWALIIPIYTASASAQELIYRAFFFWRYKGLLPPLAIGLINVIGFGWLHIVFQSWVSVGLALGAGAGFTALYLWRPCLVGVICVHTVTGLAAFTTFLGHYFYHGGPRP